MAEYTKQFAQFLEDARKAGYTLTRPDPARPGMILLSSGEGNSAIGCAEILTHEFRGKIRFYKAQPVGGAQTAEDFWTMKGLRERFRIFA